MKIKKPNKSLIKPIQWHAELKNIESVILLVGIVLFVTTKYNKKKINNFSF